MTESGGGLGQPNSAMESAAVAPAPAANTAAAAAAAAPTTLQVAVLCKTATEAQKQGQPYFIYNEEALPLKKQPLQYVPKYNDWYCRICGCWVDDEQEVCHAVDMLIVEVP